MRNTDTQIKQVYKLFSNIKHQILMKNEKVFMLAEKEILLNSLVIVVKTLITKEFLYLKTSQINKQNIVSTFQQIDKAFAEIFNEISFLKKDIVIIKQDQIQKQIIDYLKHEQSIIDYLEGKDLFSQLYENILSKKEKEQLGLFYTPEPVVNFILDLVKYKQGYNLTNKKLLDPSCGSGSFLVKAVSRLKKTLIQENLEGKEIMRIITSSIYGIDVDPLAVFLTKSNLLFQILPLVRNNFDIKKDRFPYMQIYCSDAINKREDGNTNHTIYDLKNRKNEFSSGFNFIVGNPPYIEAKKMRTEVKITCIENFPTICKGAFDIYICFIKLGLELLARNGTLGFIIPNKFLSANYSKKLRKEIMEKMNIQHIVDLSSANIFKKASVYPVIITVCNNKNRNNSTNNILICKVEEENINFDSIHYIPIAQKFFQDMPNYFIFSFSGDKNEVLLLEKLLSNSPYRLGDFLRIRWTVSFHKKGLREQFVFVENKNGKCKKFLGGKKFGGNSEVKRYSINWNGYWIDYNRKKAKDLNNPFPDISLFNEKKIILCQNSKRIRAALDKKSFVCKDIFFVGKRTKKAIEQGLEYEIILAILNSKLMSYMYDKMFSSTHVSGRYLHYLPTYLHSLPFPKLKEEEKRQLFDFSVKIMDKISNKYFLELDKKIDKLVYDIFKLSKEEQSLIENYVEKHMKLKKQKDPRK